MNVLAHGLCSFDDAGLQNGLTSCGRTNSGNQSRVAFLERLLTSILPAQDIEVRTL